MPLTLSPDDFTPKKVYVRLAALLDRLIAGRPITALQIDRYSLDDIGGIRSQVSRQGRLRGDDPATQAYLAIPEGAFDPNQIELAEEHEVVFLRLSYVHPNAVGNELMGALVVREGVMFARLTTSATRTQIVRVDGDDDNCYTILVLALADHLRQLGSIRWADDTRRAGRTTGNWTRIMGKCRERGVPVVFGTRSYDPQSDDLLLQLLGGMNQQDDLTRRQTLGGGRYDKLLANACPIPEGQLPCGLRHERLLDGRVRNDKALGHLAEWDPIWWPHVAAVIRLHANGTSYTAIGEYLAKHKVPRHGQQVPPGSTYADLLDRRSALSEAAKNFLVNDSRNPRTEWELYTNKIRLWRTGRYPYRVNNDIKMRGVLVGGLRPDYADDTDTTGFFDFELDWGGPVDPGSKLELIGLGVPDEIWQTSEQRLRNEVGAPRTGRDARPEATADQRVFGAASFGFWQTQPTQELAELYPDATTIEWGTTSRRFNSGLNAVLVVHRDYTDGTASTGRRRGMLDFAGKLEHRAGTFRLAALCSSLAEAHDAAIATCLTELDDVPAAADLPAAIRPERDDQRRRLEQKLRTAEENLATLTAEADGLRTAAGLCAARGDLGGFERYNALATERDVTADRKRDDRNRLQTELETLNTTSPSDGAEEAIPTDLALHAYLSAGLHRAGERNGRSSPRFAALAQQHYVNWTLLPDGPELHWTCELTLPVRGGERRLPLASTIANIREGRIKDEITGRTPIADLVAAAVLRDGRDLAEISAELTGGSRSSALTQQLMPWLVAHGCRSRGAKNALADHPIRAVQQTVYAAFTGAELAALSALPKNWRRHVEQTYTDRRLHWGDSAVPDDLTDLHNLTATLAQPQLRRTGVPVGVVARHLGHDEPKVRAWIVPKHRPAGFRRPVYLEYADSDRHAIRAISCPHRDHKDRPCGGVCDLVALLPEVSASGFGVLCSTCLRAPRRDGDWPNRVFPAAYRTRFTGLGGAAGSLRDAVQTFPAPAPVVLDLDAPVRHSPRGEDPAEANHGAARRWALRHGIPCPAEGAVPRSVRERYVQRALDDEEPVTVETAARTWARAAGYDVALIGPCPRWVLSLYRDVKTVATGGRIDRKTLDGTAVRRWARHHGLEVSTHGRLPSDLLDRYVEDVTTKTMRSES